MKITKHGQSCLFIETKGKKILVDPGIYAFGEEHEHLNVGDFTDTDVIVATHEHEDHFYLPAILGILRTGKTKFLGTAKTCELLKNEMPEADMALLKDGIIKKYDNIVYSGFDSIHGPLPDGSTPPPVCGIVIDDGGKRVYATGDTIELNKEVKNIDAAFVPICGVVVMTIEEAKEELLKLEPKVAVGYHYDNPRFPVDPEYFLEVMKNSGVSAKLLEHGESIEI